MDTVTFQIHESEEAWHQARHQNINSTESSALFGLNKYKTAIEVWAEKCQDQPTVWEGNRYTKMGQLLEPLIARAVCESLSVPVVKVKAYATRTDARMGSSFDFMVPEKAESKYAGWLVECKNVSERVYYSDWTEDEAPPHIEVQVQHQMHCMPSAPGTIIAALVGGNDLRLVFRERDDEFGDSLREEINDFWAALESGMTPEYDWEKEAAAIARIHSNAVKGKVMESDDSELVSLVQEYRDVQEQLGELNDRKTELKARMLVMAGDAAKVVTPAGTIVCGPVEGNEGTLVTEDMVGTRIGGREGYRMFRINKPKEAK